MKKTILILSLLLPSCRQNPNLPNYPDVHLYTPDLANHVCAEYALNDATKITFKHVADHPLLVGGPCDHLRGYEFHDFKKVQNWVRDVIAIALGQE